MGGDVAAERLAVAAPFGLVVHHQRVAQRSPVGVLHRHPWPGVGRIADADLRLLQRALAELDGDDRSLRLCRVEVVADCRRVEQAALEQPVLIVQQQRVSQRRAGAEAGQVFDGGRVVVFQALDPQRTGGKARSRGQADVQLGLVRGHIDIGRRLRQQRSGIAGQAQTLQHGQLCLRPFGVAKRRARLRHRWR